MKKVLVLVCLCAVFAGCAPKRPSATLPQPTLPSLPEKTTYFLRGDLVVGGSHLLQKAQHGQGSVSFDQVFAGSGDHRDPAVYTLRQSISSTTGMKWAPPTWETADDRYVLELISSGFYEMALNTQGDGFTFVCEMAAAPPQDVTEEYAGRFGITAGETGRAWRILLNPQACWADGEAINADTYLYSYQQLLHPKMHNRRADSVYAGAFSVVGAREYLYGQAAWDQVGIVKEGEYALVFVTASAIADPEFYVPYYLMSTPLVYPPLWEACKTGFDQDGKQVDPVSPAAVTISTNYGTSLDTTMSYGPYRLTYFELDKQITLERNEKWYGYRDDRHHGQYQADRISCQVLSSYATELLAFLSGELDSIQLQAQDLPTYAASPAIRYMPESYTTKLTFNTSSEALGKRGNQILANVHFRKAISLAIDRARFAAGYTAAGVPGFGLINEMYVYDPFTGASYRESPGAKNALVQLYQIDPDRFGDLSQAYNAITGYDVEYARALMDLAAREAIRAGDYDGVSPIVLQLSVYQSQEIYVQMFRFLQEALQQACRSTALEGKVQLQMVVDADYYATMESGLTDLIFSTWGGSSFDPYSILYQCYCDAGAEEASNQMEYGFDAAKVQVRLRLDGRDFTHSLQRWARWCAGEGEKLQSDDGSVTLGAFREYDATTRCQLYADLEFAYLSQYVAVPLYERNSAMLLSHKGDYPVRQYIDPVGFGGVRFYSFRYDDATWETVKKELKY